MGCDNPGSPTPCTCEECENCDSCQTYCEVSGQTIREICGENIFSFSVVPAKDVIIGPGNGFFNQDVWNEIITWINKGRELPVIEGKNSDNGGSNINFANQNSNTPFYASEFNRIAKIVYQNEQDVVNPNDIIAASLFTDLVNSANVNNLVSSSACAQCNAGCDQCDDCQACDSCEGCNTCQDCDSCNDCTDCMVYCQYCDICDDCTSGQTPPQENPKT